MVQVLEFLEVVKTNSIRFPPVVINFKDFIYHEGSAYAYIYVVQYVAFKIRDFLFNHMGFKNRRSENLLHL
jgi:hypothetical protein